MGWHCIVPKCEITENKNPNKLSSFRAPKNQKELWKSILKCSLEGAARVCEKHFSPDDLLSNYYVEHKDSSVVILNQAYERKRLKPGALPKLEFVCNEMPLEAMRTNDQEKENINLIRNVSLRPTFEVSNNESMQQDTLIETRDHKKEIMYLNKSPSFEASNNKSMEQDTLESIETSDHKLEIMNLTESTSFEFLDSLNQRQLNITRKKMETEAMDTDTGEVRIKQEHAYAFSEVTNTNAGRVQTLEEDPLKLTDQDADKIKAETEEVQIKIEVDHESFDCSMIKTENSELSLSETTSDMDKASGTGDGHVICKINNSYSITDDGESGSSPQMVDLLNKNKNMEYRILTSNNLIEQLQRENKSLKATISKLNLSKESDKSLNSIFENFNKDINGARSLACNLQGEMRQLEQQSEQLQKRIIEVSSLHKSYDHLKRKIATLKFQASQLYNVKNNSAEALKAMKSHVIQKENANININTRLESSLIKLGRLKSKILEMNRLKIQNAEISKLNEEMRRQLNDNKKIRRLYEDHADLIKKQVHSTVKEKEHAIEKLKKEIDELTTINRHKTTVITKLSNRQKDLEQKQEAAVSEWKNTVAEAQESLHTERDKLKQKNNELVFLREEVAMLKVELEKNTMKKCEYCGM